MLPPFSRIALTVPVALVLTACNAVPEPPESSSSAASSTPEPTGSPTETQPPESTSPSPSEAEATQCGAGELDEFINVLPTDDILAKIRAKIGDKPIRTVGPNDAITMDFNPTRLNIETGEDGRIKQFRCY